MKIKIYHCDVDRDIVRDALLQALDDNAFRASVSLGTRGGDLTYVRRTRYHEYCGSHPMACEIRGRFGQRRQRAMLLEGGDWIQFNDLVNDIFDRYMIDADVGLWTGRGINIRLNTSRRINYRAYLASDFGGLQYEWSELGLPSDYEDWTGRQAPRATGPGGTPNLPKTQWADSGNELSDRITRVRELRAELKKKAKEASCLVKNIENTYATSSAV